MTELAFDVKPAELNHGIDLLTDPVRGYMHLSEGGKKLLLWVCKYGADRGWHRFTVTEFGRLRIDQLAVYLPTYMQQLREKGLDGDKFAVTMARDHALARYSRHCINKATGQFDAFDLRATDHTEAQRNEVMNAAVKNFGQKTIFTECHRVPGNELHFHFQYNSPAGRPLDWL